MRGDLDDLNNLLTKQNLYDLLGNDVVDPDQKPFVAPKEVVRPQRSTKKSGINSRADKSKARKNRGPRASGNEAGVKHNNRNRSVEGPRETRRKGGKSRAGDKHSRTGRKETSKSEKSKLGEEAAAQVQGEEDAKAEEASDADEEKEEDTTHYRGFEDYLKEVKAQRQALGTPANVDTESTACEAPAKKEEYLIAPTATKKVRTKARKEKKLLNIDIVMDAPRGDSDGRRGGFRGGRGGFRGGRGGRSGFRGGRGGRGGRSGFRGGRGGHKFSHRDGAAKPSKKQAPSSKSADKLTEENFPSL